MEKQAASDAAEDRMKSMFLSMSVDDLIDMLARGAAEYVRERTLGKGAISCQHCGAGEMEISGTQFCAEIQSIIFVCHDCKRQSYIVQAGEFCKWEAEL